MLKTPLTSFIIILLVSMHASGEIYKWVDENGTIHFTDTPYSENAQEVEVKPTHIKLHDDARQKNEEISNPSSIDRTTPTRHQKPATSRQAKNKISASDYTISSSVGKLRDDYMLISGRIGKGPVCDEMEISAAASNENGLRASITDTARLSTSGGSVTFSGKQKVANSSKDHGFWSVDSVTVRCLDEDVEANKPSSPYRFTASVGEVGADIIRISGRVASGPKCENLIVTASATTDTELNASITTTVSKPNSFGSVVFEGNAKVDGSSEDNGFWDIDSVSAVCKD